MKVDRIGVEAPRQQGANPQEYSGYFKDSQRRYRGWIGAEAVDFFRGGR